MKKYFVSLTIGVTAMLAGVVSLIQASNTSLVTMADEVNGGQVSSRMFLSVVGAILFAIGFILVLLKYLYREKK
jgi:formate hydrogenlyase subunit 3/multisubunit Na+/H+ antiporter MnhD subunit